VDGIVERFVVPAKSSRGASEVSYNAPLLTVIVPVFNEAATINELLRRVIQAPYSKQIVVVDDGSTDGTSDILSLWERVPMVQICRHDRNRGKGRSIRTALEHACGHFVIIQDGDLETDPHDYPLLIEPLARGQADFVIGSRFASGTELAARGNSLFRLGVQLLNLAIRVLYGARVSDEACCYKALSTQVLKSLDLHCERFEFCPEVVAKAIRLNLRIAEVAIRYYPRTAANGKKLRYRDGLRAIWCLWKLRGWEPATAVHFATREQAPSAANSKNCCH
jgi:dolichol-phosphate mannosyltransferase